LLLGFNMLILDVVNEMLATMGESRLRASDVPHHHKVDCLATLDRINKAVQARGYWFNRDVATLEPITLPGPSLGRIALPVDVIAIERDRRRCTPFGLSTRGPFLYNNAENTHVFTQPVPVILVRLIPFESLPETAAAYIASKAVLEFQSNYDGDTQKSRELLARIEGAEGTRANLNAQETRESQVNLIDSNVYIQRVRQAFRNRY
jgi:hypothetical protein